MLMNTKSFLVCFMVVIAATSVAMAGSHHGNFGGGFARGGTGSFHGGNWNHNCHGGHSSFVFIGGFPFFGYPYGYGYYPYGYGYGGGYYGYGQGYYGYGAGYYGNGYTATGTTGTATTAAALTAATATIVVDQALAVSSNSLPVPATIAVPSTE